MRGLVVIGIVVAALGLLLIGWVLSDPPSDEKIVAAVNKHRRKKK